MIKTAAVLLGALFATVPAYGVDFHIYNDPTGVMLISPQPESPPPLTVPVPVAAPAAMVTTVAQVVQRVARPQGKAPRYQALVEKAAAENQVDAALLHAVITAESSYNPRAISRAGAVGLMQLLPSTARRFGVSNLFDPAQNIRAGARYLAFLLKKFGNNTSLAVAAYNAGEGAVMRHGYQIPPYAETQKYVPKVLRYYELYRQQS